MSRFRIWSYGPFRNDETTNINFGLCVSGLLRWPMLAAGDDALLLAQCAPHARLDETIQDLNDDTALFPDDRSNRAAADRRRNLLKRESRHGVSPRR
jgi:hypothetical protein